MDGSSLYGAVLERSPPLSVPETSEMSYFRLHQFDETGGIFRFDTYDWSQFDPKKYGYAIVPLTKGYFALIDLRDHKRVMSHGKWQANVQRHPQTGEILLIYAVHSLSNGGREYLHRFVIQAGGRIKVDHGNNFTLDCRRKNLNGAITLTPNGLNTYARPRTVNMHLPRGVELRAGGRFGGVIKIRGKNLRSKMTWRSPEPAHRWYKRRVKEQLSHNGYPENVRIPLPVFPPRILYSDEDFWEEVVRSPPRPAVPQLVEAACPF